MGGASYFPYAAAMRRLPLSKVGGILFLLVTALWAALNLIGNTVTVVRGPTAADDAWEDGLTSTYPQEGADRRLTGAQQGGCEHTHDVAPQ